jgi:hypothetical protein
MSIEHLAPHGTQLPEPVDPGDEQALEDKKLGITPKQLADAAAYEARLDAWADRVERAMDSGLGREQAEAQIGTRPDGETPYELRLRRREEEARILEHRKQKIREAIADIDQRIFDPDQREHAINAVFVKDRIEQERLHQHDPEPFVYRRPELD